MASIDDAMPSGTTAGKPQVLLGHHLKQLKLDGSKNLVTSAVF